MRLLVVSESPLELIDGVYYAFDPWVRLPLQLAEYTDVTLLAPVRSGTPTVPAGSWRVDLGRLRVERQDFYHSFIGYYRFWPRRVLGWQRRTRELVAGYDIVVIRVPSPSVSLITNAARRAGKPLVFVVVSDMLTQSDPIIHCRGLKRAFYIGLARLFVEQERRCGRHAAIVYAYNREIEERHRSNGRPVKRLRDPHLRLRDIVFREDTCQSDWVRLLRVAWLVPSKGLEHLLDSVAVLKSRGRRVRLEIVGKEKVAGYKVAGYEQALRACTCRLGIEDAVTFTGWVAFDRIREVYLRNDIHVISSLAEGSPRCIDEGAACGVPLVSTSVGGCADVLEHERTALLVPPGDPVAMADAVERVIDDGELRRRLIANGYALARAGAFETVGSELLEDLRALCCSPPN